MTDIERIEEQIRRLRPEDLAALREWFLNFDADAWDRQLEADARAGRLDGLAAEALREHRDGNSKPL